MGTRTAVYTRRVLLLTTCTVREQELLQAKSNADNARIEELTTSCNQAEGQVFARYDMPESAL